MKVKIQTVGLFSLSRVAGSVEWEFDFPGQTVADLIGALIGAYGQEAREALLNSLSE